MSRFGFILLVFLLTGCQAKRVPLASYQGEEILREISRRWSKVRSVEGALSIRYHQRAKLPLLLRGSFFWKPNPPLVPYTEKEQRGGMFRMQLYDLFGRRVSIPDSAASHLRTIFRLWQGRFSAARFDTLLFRRGVYLFSGQHEQMEIWQKKKTVKLYEKFSGHQPGYSIRAGRLKKISGIYWPHLLRIRGEDYYADIHFSKIRIEKRK